MYPPFGPRPDWYETYWYSPDPVKRPRPRITPILVAVVCALLAAASVAVSPVHIQHATRTMHIG
jgi:hypothetical protein